jgi:hypothetical protein
VYDARMGSEPASGNGRTLHEQHIAAVGRFDHELDSLMYPITKEKLIEATRRLIIGLFEYGSVEATARISAFDAHRDLPIYSEIEHDQESLTEMLRLGLFDRLPEEYILLHGKEEFDCWIGPYLRSVLRGHIGDSQTFEHLTECPEGERYCLPIILSRMMNEELTYAVPEIEHNEIYIPYANEMIHMNIRIVEVMTEEGIYTQEQADKLLGRYQNWVEDMEVAYQIAFDEKLFKRIKKKK